MPSPSKGPRLGGSPAHERLLLANLATALFEHGKITTTEAKAKRLRPLAERLITFAKRGDLAARRRTMTVIRDKGVVHVLFTEIGPRYGNRPGGYTRITKIGPRKGDNAPMAVIELVEALDESKPRKSRATKPKKQTEAKKTAAAPVAEETAPADEPGDASSDDQATVEGQSAVEDAPVGQTEVDEAEVAGGAAVADEAEGADEAAVADEAEAAKES